MNEFDRIDLILKEKGISRRKLAEMLGIPYGTFGSWFKRGSIPSRGNLEKIAHSLNVNPADLMGWGYLKPNVNVDTAFQNQLSELGYMLKFEDAGKDEGYWQDEKDGDTVIGRSRVPYPSTFEVTLIKDGKSATFTEEEYSELRFLLADVIEARFNRKAKE